MEKQQISKVSGHKSVVIRNYKRTSMKKQQEVSDIRYGKTCKASDVKGCRGATSSGSLPTRDELMTPIHEFVDELNQLTVSCGGCPH